MLRKIVFLTELLLKKKDFNNVTDMRINGKIFLELFPMYELFVAATFPNLGNTQHDSWETQFFVSSFRWVVQKIWQGTSFLHTPFDSPLPT
jgi:hypothetical protein